MQSLKHHWRPHTGQQPILESDARIKVLAHGRQFGATTLGIHTLLNHCSSFKDQTGWFLALTTERVRRVHQQAREAAQRSYPVDLEPDISDRQTLSFANGSRLNFLPNWRVETLRHDDSALPNTLVVDGAADFEAFHNSNEVAQFIRSSHSPQALICSTPGGEGWFLTEYKRGFSSDYPETASWQKTTFHNPHVDLSDMRRMQSELPDKAFRRGYLAEFQV
jgi:hypothetical protein